MERQRAAEATLLELLISETARVLGNDANFLGNQIIIRKRPGGEPNWDANCGIAGVTVVHAFGIALRATQAKYNID